MGNNSGFYAIHINGTDTIRSIVAGSDVGSDYGTQVIMILLVVLLI